MIEVGYKCKCMKEMKVIFALERRADEDILDYMTCVITATLYLDHRALSPDCHIGELEFVQLLIPKDAEFIGQGEKKI